ncbi:hypothetical protein KUF71_023161, partial [Frankliniella fusca]
MREYRAKISRFFSRVFTSCLLRAYASVSRVCLLVYNKWLGGGEEPAGGRAGPRVRWRQLNSQLYKRGRKRFSEADLMDLVAVLCRKETNFALQLKGWRENMENFCGSKPPEGGCGSRQAQGFYPLWQPTASVFYGNRRFADCDPIAQFDRFDPRTTIGLPL